MPPPKKNAKKTGRGPGRPTNPDSKRARGEDRHANPRETFHAPADLLGALEKYVEEAKPKPAKSSVLRLALEEFLTARGYWPPKTGGGKD